jgi:hypothetical protein
MNLGQFVLLLILPLAAISPMMQLEDVALEDVDSPNEAARSGGIVVMNPNYEWRFTAGDYVMYDSTGLSQNLQANMAADPQWDRVQVNWVDEIRVDFYADTSCSFASYSGQCHHMSFTMGFNFTSFNDTHNERMTNNLSTTSEELIPINYNGWSAGISSSHTRMWMGEQNQGDQMRGSFWNNDTSETLTTGWVTNYTLNDYWTEHEHIWSNTTTDEFTEMNNSGNWAANPPYNDSDWFEEETDWVFNASQEVPMTFNGYNLADSAGSAPTTLTGIMLDVWVDDKGTLIEDSPQLNGEYGYPLSSAGGNITELYHLYGASAGTDTDGDGVFDGGDLCPNTLLGATVDGNGCSWEQRDDDNDGVLNPADSCANTTPAMTDVDAQGCAYEQRDDDNDGVLNSDDDCSNTTAGETVDVNGCSLGQLDSDNDGVSDANDACPGYDDTVDVDADGTPDGCDSLIDSDGDNVADSVDECPGHNDSIDVDADGTPDGCDSLVDSDSDGVADSLDACPGYNDSIDVDGDGTPDDCDSLIDSDGDNVADSSDVCPGHNDAIDADADGTPDGCDDFVDSDSDGVSDANDTCAGHDDSVDADADGTPDGCDSLIDSDGDGVSDANDACPGYIDSFDVDADGTPDGCDDLIDNDGDGVGNGDDLCPNTASGASVDGTGCKTSEPAASTASDGGGFTPLMGGLIVAIIAVIAAIVFVVMRRGGGGDGGGDQQPPQVSQMEQMGSFGMEPVATPAVSTPADLPPQSGGPPLPASGLPAGWTMEQWEHYGEEYLRKWQG